MIRILLYIKHKVPIIWNAIEKLNGLLYSILYKSRMDEEVEKALKEFRLPGFETRQLNHKDLTRLSMLYDSQEASRVTYFNPHGFDQKSLLSVSRNPAFLMMGVFEGHRMVGYFFLRFFWNKKCFVGRLIDQPFEGKGIGRMMNSIMYNIGWRMGFKVLSTISRKNSLVMKSHANNSFMKVLRELDDDYLFVQFVEKK